MQTQLSDTISKATNQAKSKLFDNFDEDVQKRVKGISMNTLTEYDGYLLSFLRSALGKGFSYDKSTQTVRLSSTASFWDKEWDGIYSLKGSLVSTRPLHLNLPAMQSLLTYVKQRPSTEEQLTFDYSHSGKNVAMVKSLLGKSGYIRVSKMAVTALDTTEYLIYSICTDDGKPLSEEYAEKLLQIPATDAEPIQISDKTHHTLKNSAEGRKKQILDTLSKENNDYYDQEMDKLDQWADDLKNDLMRELEFLEREIRALRREAREAMILEKKLELGRQQKEKEDLRKKKRARLFDEQDEISNKKDQILDELQQRLHNNVEETELFTIGWKVV